MDSIGNNIRKIRELKGVSPKFMADKLNLSLSAYNKIERDETDLKLSRIKEIADLLEVPVSKILDFNVNFFFENVSNSQIGNVQNINTSYNSLDELLKAIHKQIELQNLIFEKLVNGSRK